MTKKIVTLLLLIGALGLLISQQSHALFALNGVENAPVKIHSVTLDDEVFSVIDGQKLPFFEPEKEGYRFTGWFTNEFETYDFNQPVTSSFRLVSGWETLHMSEAFKQEISVNAGGVTATATVTGTYEVDRVLVEIDVVDPIITTNNTNIGLRDNVEINIQSVQSDKHDPNYTLNFLATADGSYWLRRATGFTTWSNDSVVATYAVRGENFDFSVSSTQTGYKVSVFFTYELLNTTKDKAMDNVRIITSMRNTNNHVSEWNYFREYAAFWGQPMTYPVLQSNGLFVLKPYDDIDLLAAFDEHAVKHNDLDLVSNLAVLEATHNTKVLQVVEGETLFSDRFFRFNYPRIPHELHELSYLFDSIDGQSSVVTEAGYVIVAAPTTAYPQLNFELRRQGYQRILHDKFPIGTTTPGYSALNERTSYYVKWVDVGEIVAFDKWAIVFFATLDEADYYVPEWMTWKAPLLTDFEGFETIDRQWQGVPGMDVTPNGRIFAGWVTGDNGEPRLGNYNVIVYSDDQGQTWHNLFIIPSNEYARTNDPEFWVRPDGKLAIYYSQGKQGSTFDGKTGVWEIIIDNPEDNPDDFVVSSQRRLFDGLLRNRPVVLSDGTWIAGPNLFSEDDDTIVYASSDQGETWVERGRAYIPNARSFDETVFVEKLDGSLWMTVRSQTGQIIQSFSYDQGYTWTPSSYTGINNPSARFQIVRLNSGNLLMINSDHPSSRINLKAFLSFDDGETWPHELMLDTSNTTYPAIHIAADDTIHLAWDRDRVSSISKVLYTTFNEDDIIAGGTLPSSRIIVVTDLVLDIESLQGYKLGNGIYQQASGGFDLISDTQDSAVAVQKRGNEQAVFFENFNETSFYIETEVTAHSSVNFDAYPKFGITLHTQQGSLFFYVDAAAKGNQNVLTQTSVGYVLGNATGIWNWSTSVATPAQITYTQGEYIKLAVARDGETLKFFVNGNLVLTGNNIAGFGATQAASVGFRTFNVRATFTDYSVSTDSQLVNEKIDYQNNIEVLYIGDSYVDTYRWQTFNEFTNKASHLNIGVGGTRVNYWQTNFDNYIKNYNPENIVMHIGINDININTSGQNVGNQIVVLFQTIQAQLPDTNIYFVSISPSVNRFHNWGETQVANQIVSDFANQHANVHYIDLASHLIDEDGDVIRGYYSDLLHLNQNGYILWEATLKNALPISFYE